MSSHLVQQVQDVNAVVDINAIQQIVPIQETGNLAIDNLVGVLIGIVGNLSGTDLSILGTLLFFLFLSIRFKAWVFIAQIVAVAVIIAILFGVISF